MKRFIILILFFAIYCPSIKAQISAGLYQNTLTTQVAIGTDPEKQIFGELRILAGDMAHHYFGAELLGQYNFKKSENYNLSGGLMVGLDEQGVGNVHGKVGLPILLSIKPFEATRNFAFVLEATPYYRPELLYFRGNIGLRYTFGKD
jgi:hypothetical protein